VHLHFLSLSPGSCHGLPMARMFLAGYLWHAICLTLAFADSQCVEGKDSQCEAAGLKSSSLVLLHAGRKSTIEMDSSSESLMGFSQMVEDLAEKVAGHNYTLKKAESDAIELIRKWIENMNKTLNVQHKEDQAEVDRVRDLIKDCTSTTRGLLTVNVSGYNQTTIKDRNAHKQCRATQGYVHTQESAACKDYDQYRKGLTPYLDGDEVPPSCLASLTKDKVATSVAATRKDMETCLVGTHTWLIPLYSRYKLCQRHINNGTNITKRCDKLQKDFESSFCTYALKLSDTCDYHSTCRKRELEDRSKTHDEVKISEQARKADYVTGRKVLCLFDVFLADNPNKTETLNRCKALQTSTSPFDIIYHPIPPPEPCSKEPNKPCDAAWTTKEYSNLAAKANTCTPCPKPVVPVKEMKDDCSGWSVNTHHIVDNKCWMGAFDNQNKRITKTFDGLQAGCTYKWKAVIDTWSSVDNENMVLTINGDGTTIPMRGSGGCSNGWTQYPMREGTKVGCTASAHGWKDCWRNFEKDFVVPDSGNANVDMYFNIDQAMSDECWGWHDMSFTKVSCPGDPAPPAHEWGGTKPDSWLVAEDYDTATDQWPNRGGAGGLFDNVATHGQLTTAEQSGHGAGAGVKITAVTGTTSTYVLLKNLIKSSSSTICTLTRYTGNHRSRILNGGSNWLWGHWGGRAGIAHTQTWITTHGHVVSPVHNWVVMCGQGNTILTNGNSIGNGGSFQMPSNGDVYVNNGGCCGGERSEFAIAEIMVWNSQNVDMAAASKYLLDLVAKGRTPQATPATSSASGAGGGSSVPMGKPSIGVSSNCVMEGDWFKVRGSASCMLGNSDGTPLVVDYTAKMYTKYTFTIKMGEANAHNGNVPPHGGFKPCNRDGTGASRGSSPELWFIDRGGDWGWGTYNGGWGHDARYQSLKGSSSDPNGMKELPFSVIMKWDGNHYTLYKWKVADDEFPLYEGKNTGCRPSDSNAFTPRLWAYSGSDVFYMKDLVVTQSDNQLSL